MPSSPHKIIYMREYRKKNRQKAIDYNREYRKKNGDQIRSKAREKWRRIRQSVLEHYGVMCACCGETRFEFLSVDHIHNDGAAHRKEVPGSMLYSWLIKSGFPDGFQTLCHNCNWAKGIYGECPHQKEKHGISN